VPKIQKDAKPLSTSGNFTSGQNSDKTESRAFGSFFMGGGKSPKTSQVFRSEMGREFVFSVISQPGMKERGGFFYFFSFSNRHELFIHLFIGVLYLLMSFVLAS
jgi:hypothetical protein